MANDPVLGLLGLARRASKLVCGDAAVCDLCTDKKARCVFVASDAGAGIARKAALYAERANVPLVTLPYEKDTLGSAIGREGSAICAVSDIGLAAAALQKLAALHPQYAEVAAQLGQKNVRIQSRKGKKKKRDRAAQHEADQASPAQRKPAAKRAQGAERGSRLASQRSANGKRPHRTGSRPISQHKPSKNPRAKRVSNRKSPRSEAER